MIIYTGQSYTQPGKNKTIFLAGPTPRDNYTASWRPEAIELLLDFQFDGDIFVPEFAEGAAPLVAEDIYLWEWTMLAEADVIAFWVPRVMSSMPGLTTNIEFGMYMSRSTCVFGAPPTAVSVEYMRWACAQNNIPQATTLAATMHLALMKVAAT